MILWRISNHAVLDGGGGLRASGRWHSKGRPVVYCAPNPATALLEILVHAEIDAEDLPTGYRFLKIELAGDIAYEEADPLALPEGWRDDIAETRRRGDDWLGSGRTALLHVPCVIVPAMRNALLNPAHPDMHRIRIAEIVEHPLDLRLAFR